MKKIAVVTTTRAEYGLLSPVIRELRKRENSEMRIDFIVTGTHLNKEYGMTIEEITERIDHTIRISVKSDTELDISKNQSEALVRFTELFMKERYNAVILLGDRYETLAIAIAAGNTRTPIFHLCGGDTTEGALDEWVRHSITKISYLHFVTNEESRRRVIQMGESPDRVFNYGSTSIDNILGLPYMTKEDTLNSIGLKDCTYALCTYHPVTMGNNSVDSQMDSFFKAIKMNPEIIFIATKSNADQGGARINKLLDKASLSIENLTVHTSLGVLRYLSLMRHAEFVMGNSSSGIIETPSFHIPTINIGDRQRGRLQAGSIINCGSSTEEIKDAIHLALSGDFRKKCQSATNPYGQGNAAEQIVKTIIKVVSEGNIELKKSFYNL